MSRRLDQCNQRIHPAIEQDRVKQDYLKRLNQAVDSHRGFGRWRWPAATCEIRDVLRLAKV